MTQEIRSPETSARPTTEPAEVLERALERWTSRGEPEGVVRWLDRELDPDGVPRRLPLTEWWPCLAALDGAGQRRSEGWPDTVLARVEGLFRAALRFSRPDGSAAFGPGGRSPARERLVSDWAARLPDPGLLTVASWWFPRRSGNPPRLTAPPLPADARPDRPLAVLRADWNRPGEFLAIDHREQASGGLVEVFGQGHRWLGPSWNSKQGVEAGAGPARPVFWKTGPHADLAEWSFRVGSSRVVRSALLLRGRRLALLAEEVEGPESAAGMDLEIGSGIEPESASETRALTLRTGNRRGPSARVMPLGLPSQPSETERGSFEVEGRSLALRQRKEGRKTWLPLLVSWDPTRDRQPARWRALTVAEGSRNCRPGTAFAVHIAWGRGEGLVIYRSLKRPALRSFIGHQTRARFLVGAFSREGDVAPLLSVD